MRATFPSPVRTTAARMVDVYMSRMYICQEDRSMRRRVMATRTAKGIRREKAPADGPLMDAGTFGRVVAKSFEKEAAGAMLLIDLDDFHGVNVNAGRDAGDKVIRAAFAVLKKWVQQERWMLGRVGGDEFALYAPGMALEAAFLRAETLRQELDA